MDDGPQKLQTTCLLLLTSAVVAAALYFLSGVLVPFVLALFLAIGLWPVIDIQIRRLRLPRNLAVLNTMLLGASLLFLVGLLVTSSVNQMLANQASYVAKIGQLMESSERFLVRLHLLEETDKPAGQQGDEGKEPEQAAGRREGEDRGAGEPGQGEPGQGEQEHTEGEGAEMPGPSAKRVRDLLRAEIGNVLRQMLSGLLAVLSQGLVVLIFLAFLLIGRDPGEKRPSGYWAEVEGGVRRYLQVKVAVSAMTGILVGTVLTILDVDLALVFAVFAFLLNFVPNIGSVIASLLPVPVVLVSDLSTLEVFLAIGIPAAIQFTVGNFLEPRWMGRSLDIHPIVVLLALIFWGTIWGMVGVILAVPVTMALKILLEKAEATSPVARWMSGGLGA